MPEIESIEADIPAQDYSKNPILFERGSVQVSTDFARINSSTYPIANISSISVLKSGGKGWGWLVGSLLCVFQGVPDYARDGGLVFISLAPIIFIVWITKIIKFKYILSFQTAGGMVKALENKRKEPLLEVKEALEKAIIIRHRIR